MKSFTKLACAAVVAAPLSLGGWAAQAASVDIVETAQSAGTFGKLIKAVEAAGLLETLKGEGPFTVFAPTDEAFAALPEGKLEALLKPENRDQLAQLLSYHVVPSKITSGDISGRMTSYQTLHGAQLDIDSAGRMTRVEEAALLTPDIMAVNGVIHVIDRVILPEGLAVN